MFDSWFCRVHQSLGRFRVFSSQSLNSTKRENPCAPTARWDGDHGCVVLTPTQFPPAWAPCLG